MGSKPLSGKIVLTVILLLAGPGPDSEYGLPRRHRDSHAKVNRNPSQDHGWLRAGSSERALADLLFPSQLGNNKSVDNKVHLVAHRAGHGQNKEWHYLHLDFCIQKFVHLCLFGGMPDWHSKD